MIAAPPEIADGGYWYVVGITEDEHGRPRPDIPLEGAGWTAWCAEYEGVWLCAVRTPLALAGVRTVDVPVEVVLAAAGCSTRPYGRIGGR